MDFGVHGEGLIRLLRRILCHRTILFSTSASYFNYTSASFSQVPGPRAHRREEQLYYRGPAASAWSGLLTMHAGSWPCPREGTVMTVSAAGTQPARTDDRSAGELVRQLSEQVSRLVRDELRLAQVEMTSKGKRAGAGIGMLGGSGVIALYGLGCLLAAAIIALAGAVAAWLAALIVGVAVLLGAAAVALAGRKQLSKAVPPVPEQAVDSVKADVAEIKERAAL